MAIFSIAVKVHKYVELLTPTIQGIQSFPRLGLPYILQYREMLIDFRMTFATPFPINPSRTIPTLLFQPNADFSNIISIRMR
jgi:hypothetical protein